MVSNVSELIIIDDEEDTSVETNISATYIDEPQPPENQEDDINEAWMAANCQCCNYCHQCCYYNGKPRCKKKRTKFGLGAESLSEKSPA